MNEGEADKLFNLIAKYHEAAALSLEATGEVYRIAEAEGLAAGLAALEKHPAPDTVKNSLAWKALHPHKEGHSAPQNAPDKETPKDAPALALAPRMPDPLGHFLEHGIKMIGCFPSGAAIASGDDYLKAFTSNPDDIAGLRAGKGDLQGRARGTSIQLFRFIPGEHGFFCLDFDRGHANGEDGIRNFYAWAKQEGKILPAILTDIDNGSFPCYSRTPSGGLHLYFRYKGTKQFRHEENLAGIRGLEAFHYGNTIAAPGSVKPKGEYLFFGTLDAAPPLPGLIERRLKLSEADRPKETPKPSFSYNRPKQELPVFTLEQLAEYTRQDGSKGRNGFSYAIARKAARPEYPYTREAVIAFLRGLPDVAGLPEKEIRTAVFSAFKERGK